MIFQASLRDGIFYTNLQMKIMQKPLPKGPVTLIPHQELCVPTTQYSATIPYDVHSCHPAISLIFTRQHIPVTRNSAKFFRDMTFSSPRSNRLSMKIIISLHIHKGKFGKITTNTNAILQDLFVYYLQKIKLHNNVMEVCKPFSRNPSGVEATRSAWHPVAFNFCQHCCYSKLLHTRISGQQRLNADNLNAILSLWLHITSKTMLENC